MSELSKDLLANAHDVFRHTSANEVLVCEDGTVFVADRESLALNHCREQKLAAPVRLSRRDAEGVAEPVAEADAAATPKGDEQEHNANTEATAEASGAHEQEGAATPVAEVDATAPPKGKGKKK